MARKKHQYTYDQWQVMRERFHIDSFEPPPPDMQIPDMKNVIAGIIKKVGLDKELLLNSIEQEWEDIVGAAVAKHTRPGKFEDKQLTIYVDNPVWLFELKQQKSMKTILVNLSKRYGANKIKKIFLVPDPDK